MSRLIVLAVSGFLASAVTVTPSFADEGTDHFCHTSSGAKSNNINECCYNPDRDGPTNDDAHPFCPGVLPDGSNYPTLDRTQTLHGSTCAAGVNCGPPADLTNIKPFYDTAANAPVPAAQPVYSPAPVAVDPVVAAPIIAAPVAAAPAFAAVPVAAGAGLAGAAGLAVVVGVGALAVAGVAAAAADDDDDVASGTVTPGT